MMFEEYVQFKRNYYHVLLYVYVQRWTPNATNWRSVFLICMIVVMFGTSFSIVNYT